MTGITERFYFLCGDAMGQNKSSNVVWHHATVTRERHEALNGHGSVLWFPGLSGCREIYHAGDSLTLFLQQLGSYELTSMGSSLKFCLVAEENADVYPRLDSPHCGYRKLRTPIICGDASPGLIVIYLPPL
jgi:hypothetical protein